MNPNIAGNWITSIIVLVLGLWILMQIVASLPGFSYGGAIIAATAAAVILLIKKGVRR